MSALSCLGTNSLRILQLSLELLLPLAHMRHLQRTDHLIIFCLKLPCSFLALKSSQMLLQIPAMDSEGPLQSELTVGSLRMSTCSSYNCLQPPKSIFLDEILHEDDFFSLSVLFLWLQKALINLASLLFHSRWSSELLCLFSGLSLFSAFSL